MPLLAWTWHPLELRDGCDAVLDAAFDRKHHDLSGALPMSVGQMHKAWIEQCDAAERIKLRYGPKAAFDYLVVEKLLNLARAAADHPEFAQELPQFIAKVRLLFTPEEMRTEIARIEREMHENNTAVADDDDLIQEDPAAVARQVDRFATIKDLLTARELGIS